MYAFPLETLKIAWHKFNEEGRRNVIIPDYLGHLSWGKNCYLPVTNFLRLTKWLHDTVSTDRSSLIRTRYQCTFHLRNFLMLIQVPKQNQIDPSRSQEHSRPTVKWCTNGTRVHWGGLLLLRGASWAFDQSPWSWKTSGLGEHLGRDTPVYRPQSPLHTHCVLSTMDTVGKQTLEQARWALVCRDAGWEGPASPWYFNIF